MQTQILFLSRTNERTIEEGLENLKTNIYISWGVQIIYCELLEFNNNWVRKKGTGLDRTEPDLGY